MDISQTPEMKGSIQRVRLNSETAVKIMLLLALDVFARRQALAHHYPGGCKAFIKAMNAESEIARNETNTRFVGVQLDCRCITFQLPVT